MYRTGGTVSVHGRERETTREEERERKIDRIGRYRYRGFLHAAEGGEARVAETRRRRERNKTGEEREKEMYGTRKGEEDRRGVRRAGITETTKGRKGKE